MTMASCFRFKGDLDDMRLEWDAYIDSTISEDRTVSDTSRDTSRADMTDRGVQVYQDLQNVSPAYRDAPCQPLLASRGSYLGQIKLSVYLNCGLLTCHVIQARHISTKRGGTCDPYVKLSLVPDESLRTRCKTDVVMDTNNPLFDEKFSFELIEEDMKKRLYISVWNKVAGKECKDEFLGCMSFGIRHIQNDKRAVNGWYYLLNEDVGRKKHLQAVVKKQHLREQTTNNNNVIPKVNQDIMWMDPYTISIRKEKSGYGFTVSGFSPVFVCRIEKGSVAEQAGLQKDDCIVRIDGLNVSRSTSDSVAKIIRGTQKQLTLEIQRPQVVTAMAALPSSVEPWQAVSSTPMTRGVSAPTLPPHLLQGIPPIPCRTPMAPTQAPPPPPPAPAWDVEVESKEPVYGNCGVFGESDPLYSTVTPTGPSRGQQQRCHSSASSSSGHQEDPVYGMIRVPRAPRQHGGQDSCGGSCTTSSSGPLPRSHAGRHHSHRNSSSSAGSTADVPNYTVCQLPRKSTTDDFRRGSSTLPRSRSAATTTAPHTQGMTSGGYVRTGSGVSDASNTNYVTMQIPKSMSSGALSRAEIYNHYRLCHDSGENIMSYPVAPMMSQGAMTSQGMVTSQGKVTSQGMLTSQGMTSHEDYEIYGHAKSMGSTGSTGSADSGSLRRSRTLPRKKKQVHFQGLA